MRVVSPQQLTIAREHRLEASCLPKGGCSNLRS